MNEKNGVLLRGLDGSNPLAFLAALGTLRMLHLSMANETVRMSWEEHEGAWRPRLWCSLGQDEDAFIAHLHRATSVPSTATDAGEKLLKKCVQEKKKAIKQAQQRLKSRRLKGNELRAAREAEIAPLELEHDTAKAEWLKTLSKVVPSPELSLGQDLSASSQHFRNVASECVERCLTGDRGGADMLAAFGSDACADPKTKRIEASLFCFITGSGHQFFLDTARDLLSHVGCEQLRVALLKGGPYTDEKLSMRWAPVEDRRYALMWSDPTSSGNEPLTSWALNLLAYRGLGLVPAAPTARGFRTAGFSQQREGIRWIWPIWLFPATSDTTRSLLSDQRLIDDAGYRRNRGIATCFSSERLVVGNPPLHKINFSPAMPC